MGPDQLVVNEAVLRRAWESSQRSTQEDWAEWARHFAVELLRNSPSPALRANYRLAEVGSQNLHLKLCLQVRLKADAISKFKSQGDAVYHPLETLHSWGGGSEILFNMEVKCRASFSCQKVSVLVEND